MLIGKLADPASSQNKKENNAEKSIAQQKLRRPYNNKSRRTNRKDISRRRLGNACKGAELEEDTLGDFDLNDQKPGVKQQKYFIVVEETSSKSTESLIFLVEEKPIRLKRSPKRSPKNTRKRPRFGAIKNSVVQNTYLPNQSVIPSNTQNKINAADSQINISAINDNTQHEKVNYSVLFVPI